MSVLQYCETMMQTREMPETPKDKKWKAIDHDPVQRIAPTRREFEDMVWRGSSSLGGAIYQVSF
jgi:hypothetical protein